MSDEHRKIKDDRQKVNEGYQPDRSNNGALRKGYQPSMDITTQSDEQSNETPPTGGSNVQPAESNDKKEDEK